MKTLILFILLSTNIFAQTSKFQIIEKTIYLTQERKFEDKRTWFNEAISISTTQPIKSISYWIGIGDESLKELKKTEKKFKLKKNNFLEALHTKKIPAQEANKQTGVLEIRLLHNYTDKTIYDCEKKYLEGGFLIYRIYSDCYWHGRMIDSGNYEQNVIWESPKGNHDISPTSASFIVRSDKKIEKPIHIRILVETF
ncbi:MAG: hypothetical protein MUC49_08620 [Raineya sp.]|jgi:hypothetical protein|nr:hypothetical protein [Raineya sp.]